ncbi:hypothetical protein F5879DRAFT_991864 [Lentinula edodes]|uniref:Uncharacterized protein n=1 Tax=Lentinula aff. lateritia TaxID=2804960 RepID=A0ACC1TVQ8_9AGAR|nr:hypothetical protein F5876DRAFT_78328 [Lentinula aff. lateritia]KAJ3901531.1 hypothetical protein F5879DRAFT_991864 [Lentinula edodes]
MLLQGLNAQRFTLPDSSEPNILKAQRLNQERCNRRRKTDTYRLKDNGTENRTSAVRSPTFLRGTFWTCVVTVLCRLFGNHRFTLLITLPLVLAYLVQKYFPSARMPKKLIGMSCTTMGVICSCALPDLFAPLRAINCNADYYVSLCGRTEAAPTETVSTYNDALFGPATSAQFPYPPRPATTTTTTTQSEQETSVLQVPVLLDSPSRNFLPLDFGLANNGAKVLPALTSPTEGSSPLSGYDKTQMHMNPPRVVLEEEVLLSNCWKFAGSQGHIAIALSDSIIWNRFTIHSPDGDPGVKLRQAPRVIVMQALVSQENILVDARRLSAWEDFVVVEQLLDPSIFNSSTAFMEVARIVYMPSEGGQQMFSTFSPVQTSIVLVQILDNWGDTSTCLHRISFHGDTLD